MGYSNRRRGVLLDALMERKIKLQRLLRSPELFLGEHDKCKGDIQIIDRLIASVQGSTVLDIS